MIEAFHLTKRYGSRVAVDDLSFEFHPGRVTGFLAQTGPASRPPCGSCSALTGPTRGRGASTATAGDCHRAAGGPRSARAGRTRQRPRRRMSGLALPRRGRAARVAPACEIGVGPRCPRSVGVHNCSQSGEVVGDHKHVPTERLQVDPGAPQPARHALHDAPLPDRSGVQPAACRQPVRPDPGIAVEQL